jgi:hypothetical protein
MVVVQVRCSCGAYPPEDARFCHKCARPLFEEDHARLSEFASEAVPVKEVLRAEPPPLPVAVASSINFHNPRAVSVSIFVAAITLLLMIPLALVVPPVLPFVFCAGGFVATFLYTRRSGESITAQSGARMGFMTCLWAFVVILLMSCLAVAMLVSPETRHAIQQQKPVFGGNPQMAQAMAQTMKSLDNPSDFIVNLIYGILAMFCLSSLLSMLGGVIAAKVARRQ